jgi:hypothetical protein
MTLSPGAFGERYVEQIARGQLARTPRPHIIHLQIYGAGMGAPVPKPDHFNFEHWREEYQRETKLTFEIAEMIARGDEVVLRKRNATGTFSKRVLSGNDPLTLLAQGQKFEIVYFEFDANRLPTFSIFIRSTSPVAAKDGLALFQALETLFPKIDVSIAIRPDIWFVRATRYPFLNPFIQDLSPPNSEDYNRSRTVECDRLSGSASCKLQ